MQVAITTKRETGELVGVYERPGSSMPREDLAKCDFEWVDIYQGQGCIWHVDLGRKTKSLHTRDVGDAMCRLAYLITKQEVRLETRKR